MRPNPLFSRLGGWRFLLTSRLYLDKVLKSPVRTLV